MKKIILKYKSFPVQVKASFWFLICSFLQKGISMITTPIFTRLLSTAEYGEFNVFNSWYSIAFIFVSLSLSSGVYTQGLVKYDRQRKIFSSSLQGLTLTLVVLWTVIYLVFKEFWNNLFSMSTTLMLAMLVMIWTSSAFGFWAAEQRVNYKYRALVVITLVVSIAKPVLGILLVTHSDDKVTMRILGLVLVEVIGYTWCGVVQIIRGKKFFSKQFWIYALSYNLPLIPHYLSQMILNNSDRIMINDMVGSDAAGIYSLAYSLAMIMTLFNNALGQTISPWMYQKIKEKKIGDIAPVAYLSIAVVIVVNMLLIAFAPEAVRIFAPKSYYEAIYCIPPVAMGVLFLYSYDLFAKFAFYYERTTMIMLASIGGAILNIVLNYIGIKMFGYIAAAYTTLICYIAFDIFHYVLMTKICNKYLDKVKPYNTRKLILVTILFLIAGLILMSTYEHPVIRYSIIVLCGIFIFIKRKMILKKLNILFSIKKR